MSESRDPESPKLGPNPTAGAIPDRQPVCGRWRSSLGVLLLITAPLLVVGVDLQRRGARLLQLESSYWLTYLGAIVESCVLWGTLLYAASCGRGALPALNAILFVLALTLTVGGQAYFFEQYNAYLNVDVSLFASNFKDSVVNQLWADFANYVWAKVFPFTLAVLLVLLCRRLLLPRRIPARLAGFFAPLFLIATFFIPTQHRHAQASTPDVLYLHAVGGLIRTQLGFTDQSNQLRPRTRDSLPVPPLKRDPSLPDRNVLFVILESVRADSTCIEFDPNCRKTEATNLLLNERSAFTQMRSLASCTAISLAVLWSGLLPTESRETLHTWPLIFDYARAANYDTAFWTSQNMMFGNARLWVKNLGVKSFVSATELDPTADLDMGAPEGLLVEHVKRAIHQLEEPFLAVVQLSNVHYPYYVDPTGPMPFEPWTTSKAPEDNASFKNFYQNAVHQQDRHIADLIRHVRKSEFGPRTVVVSTSDHGEAFREHGTMGHTFTLFDEEIRVPAWLDAPQGTLTTRERSNLTKKRDAFLFHIDIAPTILDLIGVGNDPALDRYRQKMPGHSLLGEQLSTQAIPMTNCAAVWSCAFENWGYIKHNLKLEGRSWEPAWQCFDLAADPQERNNLGPGGCPELVRLAETTFGRKPGRRRSPH